MPAPRFTRARQSAISLRPPALFNFRNHKYDAHELIALCAPRPVFLGAGSATGDAWVDPRGMFLAEVAAGPVYSLLGKKPLASENFPSADTPLLAGDLAFRVHSGGHTPDPNWPTFLMFAGRYLNSPPTLSGKHCQPALVPPPPVWT